MTKKRIFLVMAIVMCLVLSLSLFVACDDDNKEPGKPAPAGAEWKSTSALFTSAFGYLLDSAPKDFNKFNVDLDVDLAIDDGTSYGLSAKATLDTKGEVEVAETTGFLIELKGPNSDPKVGGEIVLVSIAYEIIDAVPYLFVQIDGMDAPIKLESFNLTSGLLTNLGVTGLLDTVDSELLGLVSSAVSSVLPTFFDANSESLFYSAQNKMEFDFVVSELLSNMAVGIMGNAAFKPLLGETNLVKVFEPIVESTKGVKLKLVLDFDAKNVFESADITVLHNDNLNCTCEDCFSKVNVKLNKFEFAADPFVVFANYPLDKDARKALSATNPLDFTVDASVKFRTYETINVGGVLQGDGSYVGGTNHNTFSDKLLAVNIDSDVNILKIVDQFKIVDEDKPDADGNIGKKLQFIGTPESMKGLGYFNFSALELDANGEVVKDGVNLTIHLDFENDFYAYNIKTFNLKIDMAEYDFPIVFGGSYNLNGLIDYLALPEKEEATTLTDDAAPTPDVEEEGIDIAAILDIVGLLINNVDISISVGDLLDEVTEMLMEMLEGDAGEEGGLGDIIGDIDIRGIIGGIVDNADEIIIADVDVRFAMFNGHVSIVEKLAPKDVIINTIGIDNDYSAIDEIKSVEIDLMYEISDTGLKSKGEIIPEGSALDLTYTTYATTYAAEAEEAAKAKEYKTSEFNILNSNFVPGKIGQQEVTVYIATRNVKESAGADYLTVMTLLSGILGPELEIDLDNILIHLFGIQTFTFDVLVIDSATADMNIKTNNYAGVVLNSVYELTNDEKTIITLLKSKTSDMKEDMTLTYDYGYSDFLTTLTVRVEDILTFERDGIIYKYSDMFNWKGVANPMISHVDEGEEISSIGTYKVHGAVNVLKRAFEFDLGTFTIVASATLVSASGLNSVEGQTFKVGDTTNSVLGAMLDRTDLTVENIKTLTSTFTISHEEEGRANTVIENKSLTDSSTLRFHYGTGTSNYFYAAFLNPDGTAKVAGTFRAIVYYDYENMKLEIDLGTFTVTGGKDPSQSTFTSISDKTFLESDLTIQNQIKVLIYGSVPVADYDVNISITNSRGEKINDTVKIDFDSTITTPGVVDSVNYARLVVKIGDSVSLTALSEMFFDAQDEKWNENNVAGKPKKHGDYIIGMHFAHEGERFFVEFGSFKITEVK